MPNLVVCCDGTWNTPGQEDNGVPSPTNVVKIFGALADADASGTEQTAYYRPGVGTSGGLLDRLKGGGLGVGLGDDIKSAYFWLCDRYRPGDTIFMFGFSRGAYAVRSLAGLMNKCGLLVLDETLDEAEKWRRVDAAYDLYRAPASDAPHALPFPAHAGVGIHFLGVWDTVGALGIPDELFINILDRPQRFQFHDTELGPLVACARHALAIDERRQAFTPTLWTKTHPDSDVEQRWFTGVHGDAGGSYAASGLGDITLKWMIEEATAKGLAFRGDALGQLAPDHLGPMHNSVKGIYTRLRTRPRSVPDICNSASKVDETARDRQTAPPLVQPDYWPSRTLAPGETHSLDIFAAEQWNRTGLFLEAGASYRFNASGEWLDANIRCSPDGPLPGFKPRKAVYALSLYSDWRQGMLRRRKGNEGTIVRGARRQEDMPWFCLVGAIANGGGIAGDSKKLKPHETIRIGSQSDHVPASSGYLYCFANDVWSFYFNNKGKVRLSVTRL